MLRGDGNNQLRARFQILGPLGAGGFGAVYEAVDTRSGQHVALKELADTSADSIARFKQEFRALTECHHENLVSMRELIEQDGRWLIVMELVPGADFLRYVQRADNDNASNAPGYDEPRLRGALLGVLTGLGALHGFGIVHRDLKPSNVRVRPDGRVVLLDFGLVTSVDPTEQSTHALGLGTVAYMAPEQAAGQSIGPAADLYALGVCLFEALTGEAPFAADHTIRLLLEKQTTPARRPRSVFAGIPSDLDALCAALMQIEPGARPSVEEALALLRHGTLHSPSIPMPAAGGVEAFAGRDAELAHLERALLRTNEGELRVVLIEGESGVGKSELVSEFGRRIRERNPQLLMLRGRCYENEQVSYKAFDGCIDELSKLLRRLPIAQCDALMPERAVLLGQLFPVLRNVPSIAQAPREGSSADPSARRLEAFSALAQLLGKLAEERPVVLVLDDLQWADAESFRLLSALSEQNPRPAVLLLGTVRPREELEPAVAEQLASLRKWRHTDVVPLFGLPEEQAQALAKQLLRAGVPEAWSSLIAEQSQGHPLFMSELVQYTQSHDFATRGKLTLEAALRARIDRLAAPARALLELVALAARPHPGNVFAQALGQDVEALSRSLLAAKLLRQRRGHELGCYHDRIRHAAVELIAKSRLPALHRQLAAALETLPEVDPSESAHHWDLAGQGERASEAYELAANKAFSALAFAKAAQLYERAVELGAGSFDQRRQQLTVRRADALSCAGHTADAAKLYLRAAEAASGEARIRLRSRAANHQILSGATGLGFKAARELLLELGFSLPSGTTAALLRYAWDTLCIALRGVAPGEVASAGEQRERSALAVVGELRRAILIVHPLAALLLGAQYARRAVRSGSPAHRAYALGWRAWTLAMRGSLTESRVLLAQGRELVIRRPDDITELASQVLLAGSAHVAALDWAGAAPLLLEAHTLAQQHLVHDVWLLTTVRYHLGMTWYHLGEHARLSQEMNVWLAEARERNDVLAVVLLTGMGHGFLRHLRNDAPEVALAELDAALAPIPQEPYAFAHFGQFMGKAMSLLYRGGPAALHYIDEHRAERGGTLPLRVGSSGQGVLLVRLLALLAAFASSDAELRPGLLREARRIAKKLVRSRSPYLRCAAQMSLAQLAAIEGQRKSALSYAEAASVSARTLPDIARSASYLCGLLEGGAAGRAKCQAVLRDYEARGWRDPLRGLAITLPACALMAKADEPPQHARAALLLDRYEITGELGSGGFGTLVSARDVRSGQTLALKELVRTSGTSIERFKREFRALSDVHHENIVQLEALFEHAGSWFIAMELVEGTDLVSYVRASGNCDEQRLRAAFAGVVNALSALHQQGLVHRDLRPDNVVVAADGRAVLIDFGLIARIGERADGTCVGNLAYSAPEQLLGGAPDAASDVYGLGACLFHALSGQAPFSGEPGEQPFALAERPVPVLAPVPGLESLCSLCLRMLAARASERPSLDQVLACLLPQAAEPPTARLGFLHAFADEGSPEWSFAGREPELQRLTALFHEAGRTRLGLLLIEGESGLGKSALVNQLARSCQRETPELLVLRSRCYENEQVAFKAFDGAIDQLALALRALPPGHCEALLPKRAALLSQLFPVLAGVPAIARSGKKGLPADPAVRKQAGRECLAQLFAALCAERPVMLIVDDLQWADSESFDLLHALRAHGEALSRLFVFCTVRPSHELEAGVAREIEQVYALPDCARVSLTQLDEDAALGLARQLLGPERDERALLALVRESKGHPLFLRELIEQEKRGLGARSAELTLDGALAARMDELSPDGRTLLELVALLGKPYGAHVFARAMQQSEVPREALVALLAQGLLRRRADKLVCYHDRIRHVALSRMSAEQRSAAAHKLALSLSRDLRTDPADKARLWDEAGEVTEAIGAYEQSGDHALSLLAFTRAEQDYARALALLGELQTDARWRRLMVSRGHALVRAGRSADAAALFQRAAEHAEGEEKVRLRLWTAQHLMQSAQVEQGLSAATKLLSELGLSLPESDGAAKARIVYERTRVKLRGIALGQRKATAHERLVLDALHGLSSPVRASAYLPGSTLVVQYLRRALSAGDPIHSARALAYEALWRSINASQADQSDLFERSRALAEATCEPALIAEIDLMQGVSSITKQQMNVAISYLARAHELLQAQCPGQPWLLTASRMYLGQAWFHSGHYSELKRYGQVWLEEARARDDRYAVAALCGFGVASFRHLLDDQPERGLEEVRAAMARWPKEPFGTNHVGAFLTTGYMLWCSEDWQQLGAMLERARADAKRVYLMRTATPRLAWHTLRAVVALRSIEQPGTQAAREALAQARADNRATKSLGGPFATAAYFLFEAWVSMLEGDTGQAMTLLQRAERIEHEHPIALGIRYTMGFLEAGKGGREKCEEVRRAIEAEGFRDFRRGLALLVPGRLALLGL